MEALKLSLLLVLIVGLAACSIWPPGQDPAGRTIVVQANRVLGAINDYYASYQSNPPSLESLIPEFLQSVPPELEGAYLTKQGHLFFTYSPSWPQLGQVACSAKIGQTQVGCHGYI